jgi:hypothetical protein
MAVKHLLYFLDGATGQKLNIDSIRDNIPTETENDQLLQQFIADSKILTLYIDHENNEVVKIFSNIESYIKFFNKFQSSDTFVSENINTMQYLANQNVIQVYSLNLNYSYVE